MHTFILEFRPSDGLQLELFIGEYRAGMLVYEAVREGLLVHDIAGGNFPPRPLCDAVDLCRLSGEGADGFASGSRYVPDEAEQRRKRGAVYCRLQ